jgi:ParB/RepB/Spo0J family partition protein
MEVTMNQVVETIRLNLSEIKVGSNHRIDVKDDLGELMDSIKQYGLFNPVSVAPVDSKGKYKLIAGFRRYHAHLKSGLKAIDARILTSCQTSSDQRILNLVENMHRKETKPFEQGLLMHKLIEDDGYTEKELSSKLNVNISYIRSCLRVSSLPEDIRKKVIFVQPGQNKQEGEIPISHVSKVEAVGTTAKLTANQKKMMYNLSAKGVLSNINANIVGRLIKSGMGQRDVINAINEYTSIRVDVPLHKRDLEKLMKKHKIKEKQALLHAVLYGDIKDRFKRVQ